MGVAAVVCIVEPAPFTPGSSKAGSDSIDVILSQLVPLPVDRSRDSFSLLLITLPLPTKAARRLAERRSDGCRKEGGRTTVCALRERRRRPTPARTRGRTKDGGRTERRRAKDARPPARAQPCSPRPSDRATYAAPADGRATAGARTPLPPVKRSIGESAARPHICTRAKAKCRKWAATRLHAKDHKWRCFIRIRTTISTASMV